MLFGGKKCDICGVNKGKNNVANGTVCNECYTQCSYFLTPYEIMNHKSLLMTTLKEAYARAKKSEELDKIFRGTGNVGNNFFVDSVNNLWAVIDNTYNENKKLVFSFDDVVGFELLQDDESILTGGLGSAIAGGVLFGGVGAIVGGIVGTKKIKAVIKKFQIKIDFKNAKPYYINLLQGPGYGASIKSGTTEYNKTLSKAEMILDIFSKALNSEN
jgi:hypothetical protein